MKTLLLLSGMVLSVASNAQRYNNSHEMPEAQGAYDKGQVLPAYESPNAQILILGESEARAAVLHGPTAADTLRRYHSFIAKVAADYESSMKLTNLESGSMIRTLAAMDALPTKYAVHFKLDGWFRANVERKRYEVWKSLPAYPEYLYSNMLAEDPQSSK
jgi:hypothetical protein